MSSYDLKAQKRTTTGKEAAGRMRREGLVPSVAYGMTGEPVLLTVGAKDLWDVLAHHHSHGLLNLKFDDGSTLPVIIKTVQRNPVNHRPQAVDFMRVALDVIVEATVPIVLTGTPIGVKQDKGVLVQALHQLQIKALPGNLPEEIFVDVSALELNGAPIHVGEIPLPEGITAVTLGSESVAVVNSPDREPEPTEEVSPTEVPAIAQKSATE